MKSLLISYIPVIAVGIFFSAVSHIIYYVLKRQEEKGVKLSKLKMGWMQVMNISRFLFLILIVVGPFFVMLADYVLGILFVIFMGFVFLTDIIKKRV